jgi:hypothetical protein
MDKIKLLSYLTAFISLVSVAGYLLLRGILPSSSVSGLFAIPLFFWLLYASALAMVKLPSDAKGFAKFMMGFKAAKMFLSLVAVTAMAFLMKGNAIVVMFGFFAFYTIMLVAESLLLLNLKKKYRINK